VVALVDDRLVLVGSHYYRLVALSVVISILGAYAARDLSERIRDARGRAWLGWLAGGATAHGIGTWSMHYTGRLAFSLPLPILYDWPTVLLSLLVGILGSAAALFVLSRTIIGWPWVLAASIFLGGVGISGLHYTAMMAMRMQAMGHYSLALVTLSVVLAIVLSWMSLALMFLVRGATPGRNVRNHAIALLRGAANPVMHYTAMAALTFTFTSEIPDLSHVVSIAAIGFLGISIVPVMVLVVSMGTTLIDRLQKQKEILQTIFDHIPVLIRFLGADGRVELVNRAWERTLGWSLEEIQQQNLDILAELYPDPLSRQRVLDFIAAATGEWVDFKTRVRDGRCADPAGSLGCRSGRRCSAAA
jgi:PAS domain S-box-containing protein